MTDSASLETHAPATDADGKLLLSPAECRSLLRDCFALFRSDLLDPVRTSIDMTNDLFELNKFVSDADIVAFRSKRGDWVKRFEHTLEVLFETRLSGVRRQGSRPDADRSLASLRVLSDFDHQKQRALTAAKQSLQQMTKRELDALDLRVGVLLGEVLTREIDNPFSPDYILDAMGMTSRALLPNPQVWRPLMERLVSDSAAPVTKTYIRLNRFLAERHVLPEIKAELRARSDLRPADDNELLPLFIRLLKETGPPVVDVNVEVPAASPAAEVAESAAPTPAGEGASAPAPTRGRGAGTPNPYVADMARAAPAEAAAGGSLNAFGLPQLDPLLALGSLSTVVAALDRWQAADPGIGPGRSHMGPIGIDAGVLPLNRIPWISAAVADKIPNPTDKLTIDVIGLLFDYIFRDPAIPESLRSLFSRLEVPTLKAGLIDRSFFSDKRHPARRLLDHLAAGAVGATTDEAYRATFERLAADVIDEVCRDFKVDVAVFDRADAKLQAFIEAEQRNTTTALGEDVAAALAAEQSEADRAQVRALMRDKLAGSAVPFAVRTFHETVWADYLTAIRKRDGPHSEAWNNALYAIDDLLWSITLKQRTGQKARLSKMIPGLIRNLRAGGAAVNAPPERMQPFLDAIYRLHIAAIRPQAVSSPAPGAATPESIAARVAASSAESAATVGGVAHDKLPARVSNIHDFVSEMVVGTWLAFNLDGQIVNARLSWISPVRTKYIFTSRARGKALIMTPEELAWQLGAGIAELVVEPVPLFDRAVSAALDDLAAKKPPARADGRAPTAVL